ncbi:carboxypeptidase-like regulatory domain-containing protein [Tellurirhabdus bombi]|uniref:carboxypeptidase-like regulatory domain-containing protein n=1 Tax=Tellurirhabdus bombi TaxID=2907205 RepID=UPI001F473713|nr:carboxypeptidase-like regulatory domain-containing protein [Tellurirhabdus bombi]
MSTVALAQTKIAGKIVDDQSGTGLAGVSLAVKGRQIGTITDNKGAFSLSMSAAPPVTIVVSMVGYQTQEMVLTTTTDLVIKLSEQAILGQEVVVSASRVEESVMKSPVAVEKMDIRTIQNSPAPNFFDALANLKGVDMATQGVLFKSVNMRGFGSTGNPRTVQMIDGMDNSAPGLNFPIDNIVGMPEQDVESVELLPGAASALYGPNAINGLILMTSKNPFRYQGLSANVKTGIMSANNRDQTNTGFYDASIRYAKAFNDKLAFKVNFSYIQAKDWQATNYDNLNLGGNPGPGRGTGVNLNYDGTNIYGDEAQANIRSVGQALITGGQLPAAALALFPDRNISRTGYIEQSLVDYNTRSFKFNGAVHYRLSEKVEAIAQVNYGFGTTVYTGASRYSLRDFALTQAKLELRGDNFTLRAYTTQERSGKSYAAGLVGVAMNEAWKPSTTWFGQYAGAFAQARGAGQSEDAAHQTARGVADQGRPLPGTEAFTSLLDRVRDTPISQGGGGFSDKSNMYHVEGLYNFKEQIKFADFLIGANYRMYELRSNGTLFADQAEGRNGRIGINEYGAFAQVSKTLLDDHLKLTGSIRYDKNQNFKGQFTPRISAVTTFGDHNIRLSYQTGFRIPTTQNQYIDLQTPAARLVGGLPEFVTRYNLTNSYSRPVVAAFGAAVLQAAANPTTISQAEALITQQVTQQVTAAVTAQVTAQVNAAVAAGQIPAAGATTAIQNGVNSVLPGAIQAQLPGAIQANRSAIAQALAINANLGSLQTYQPKEFKPERVANYEIGYRGLFGKKLFIDAYYYYSVYTDFIGSVVLLQPTASVAPGQLPVSTGVLSGSTRTAFSFPANSSERITASGWAVGVDYQLPKGFLIGGNISNNTLNNFTPSAEVQYSSFNTPKYRWNLSVGNRNIGGSKIGFNVSFKHQDSFVWESSVNQPTDTSIPLFQNTQVPAISNLDAQVSYKVSRLKSIVKLGGTNLGGKLYYQAYGSAYVGSVYYVSLTFDELLN